MVADRSIVRSLPAICQFGRYELLGRIAVGGMAEIFLARERENVVGAGHRHLVIKRVLSHVADDETFQAMFFDEARLAMRLQHPAIVHIYEFGEEADSTYLAMEWVDGVALGKLIRRGREVGGIPAPVAVKVAATVAEALHYAHRVRGDDNQPLGIVHRDVSPQNIMISNEGSVKLLDFGIAKATDQLSRTSDGQVKGKFAYMAPEQCVGEAVDGRADVFALGVCLYEALTGRPLYHRKTQYETMRAVLEDPLPSIAVHRPDLPPDLDEIVRKALEKKAEDRFQSAGEMQVALEHWLARQQEVVPATRIADLVAKVFGEEARRGPQVDSTPFGESFRGSRPSGPSSPIPSVSGSLPAMRPSAPPALESEPSSALELASSELMPESDELADFEEAEEKSKRGLLWLALAALALLVVLGGVGAYVWLGKTTEQIAAVPVPVPVAGSQTPATNTGAVPPTVVEGAQDTTPTPNENTAAEAANTVAANGVPNGEPNGVPSGVPSEVAASDSTGTLQLTSRPSGAQVRIDGRFRGETPLRLDGLPSGEHIVELTMARHQRETRNVEIAATETTQLSVRLRRRRGSSMATGPVVATMETAETMEASPMTTMATPMQAGQGFVSVNTRPWSKVYLGDRLLGTTPLGRVSVPAGSVRLRFEDRDGNEHRRSVRVSAGEVARAFFDFSE